MNCRSRAEGLARRLGTGLCQASLATEGATVGQALLQPHEDPDHYAIISYRKSSLCDSGDGAFGDLRPLHVVTSEPSLHLCLGSETRDQEQENLLQAKQEQDSDFFYDFGVEDSPEEGTTGETKMSLESGQTEEQPEGEGDRTESGCVTQITSPDLCISNLNHDNNDGHGGGAPPDLIPRIPDIDLQEVSQILSSSSIADSNPDSICERSPCHTTPSPLSLSYHEDVYEKLIPTPNHSCPSSPRGRFSPLPDCGYVGPDTMASNKSIPAAVALVDTDASAATAMATCMSGGGVGVTAGISCESRAPGAQAPPGGSVSPRSRAIGACWCHTQQCQHSDNAVPSNDSSTTSHISDTGDVDINEYCNCDKLNDQVITDSTSYGEGAGDDIVMAQGLTGLNVSQGQTSDECENHEINDIVSESDEFDFNDMASENVSHGLANIPAAPSADSSCGKCEGVTCDTEDKVTTGGDTAPPPLVSPPLNTFTLKINNHVPNANTCHKQTEGPFVIDDISEKETIYLDEDQEDSITTLSEDEVREAENEDNDEDVEEEAIITGKFRNILGYQERVRRISEDECPTAPYIPGLPTIKTSSSSSSRPVLRINDPCGFNISISEPERHIESSNQNLGFVKHSLDSGNKISYGGFRKYASRRRRSFPDDDKELESPSSGSITPLGPSSLEFISSLDVPDCQYEPRTPPLPPNTLPPPSELSPDEEEDSLEPEYYENLPEPKEDATLARKESKLNIEELAEELEQLKAEDDVDEERITEVDIEVEPPSNESSRETSEEPDPEKIEEYRNSMKRSSSLKFTKSPPGTPRTKKIVKFADLLGLDLADVRTFVDGIPHIPKSAFWDLPDKDKEEDISTTVTSKGAPSVLPPLRILSPLFRNPVDLVEFPTILENQKVCLEKVVVGKDLSVKGVVRVLNLAFDKRIIIRYTFDQWRNIHEATATYIPGSSNGDTDQFSFMLWGSFLQDNGTMVFCVRYQSMGMDFWDSNKGSNYTLHCSTPTLVTPQHPQEPESYVRTMVGEEGVMGLSVIPTWDELGKKGQGTVHGLLGGHQGSLYDKEAGRGRVSSWSSSSSSNSSISSSFNSDSQWDSGLENTGLSLEQGNGTKTLRAAQSKEPSSGCAYMSRPVVSCQDMNNVQNATNVKSSFLLQRRVQLPYLAHQAPVLRSVFADAPATPPADPWLHKFL